MTSMPQSTTFMDVLWQQCLNSKALQEENDIEKEPQDNCMKKYMLQDFI